MSKTISTIHIIDKKASLKELMSLIEQMKNYDAIKNEGSETDFTPKIRHFPHSQLPHIAQNIYFVQLEQKL